MEETTLTPANVGNLLLKWKVQLKNEPLSLTALTAPVVADHVETSQGINTLVYVARSRGELASIDSVTGCIIWPRDLEVHALPKDKSMWLCPNNLNATPVIAKPTGTIYAIATDGRFWGPASATALKFAATNDAAPHGCSMTFKLVIDSGTHEPTPIPEWISGDLDLPDPPFVANEVVFFLSTSENPMQTTGGKVITPHTKLLTDQQREADTHNAALFALDARTGKTLYQSGNTVSSWTHFSGLAVADGQIYAVDRDSYLYCFGLGK